MNWSKALIAGVVSGIVLFFADFVMHGLIMANTYAKYPVFVQEDGGIHWFLLISLCIGIALAILFAKTRQSWADGAKGGATFGFWTGLVVFFTPFYSSLVIEGFPYYLSWCQGGIILIGMMLMGATMGMLYKRS